MTYVFYHFSPSKPACIISILCYGISTIYHVYQLVQLKCYFFTTFVIGATTRIISANDTTSMSPYIAQSICILLPPSLYAATIYMIYGRIVIFTREPRLSPISPYKVTKIFVIGDAIAFLTQSSGGGMMAIKDMADMGQKITIVGLFVQLGFFGLFLTVTLVFVKRLKNRGKDRVLVSKVDRLLFVLLGVAALIIARCVYRIVEFVEGNDGYLMGHEVFMYVFDTLPMFVVQSVFHLFHPGRVLVEKTEYIDIGV
ncbi:hypothetical protein EYZ11_005588 [Aspergillus tanneri]|uniref:RTA1 like protein n=1 Tax=Aspergillus tanneri TaxID=1220188 RepID=A0A4S3JHM5_9EURO|nr:hypothetical protein EYZ11_005588 [Aspergillus tanneri]